MRDLYEYESLKPVIDMKHFETELMYVSYSKYGKDWAGDVHSHYFTEIFYTMSGEGFLSLENDATHPLREGDVVIVNPNVDHVEIGNHNNPLEYIVVGISGLEFDFKNEEDCGYSVFNAKEQAQIEQLFFYFHTMVCEMKSKPRDYALVCKLLLDVILIKINRRLDSSVIYTEKKIISKESSQVKRYIDYHFSEDINLDLLADIVHMNKYHLVHLFKKEHGISPISYLNHKRISESKHLLTTTNHSLSKIAHILGFSSLSYFSQSFKKIVKISPNEYRRLYRKK